jgi:protein-S-isoprenylcysteine O-methyltransferase Ste14
LLPDSQNDRWTFGWQGGGEILMFKQIKLSKETLSASFITLLALTIVYVAGMTFVTVEIERLVERMLTPHIRSDPGIATMQRAIFSDVEGFMQSHNVRLIGYVCLGLIVLLTLAGIVTRRRSLSSLGSAGAMLSIYAYFVIHMSFLAGLGVLAGLWLPFWGDLVKLGDVVYLPYMLLVFPFSLAGVDIRFVLANAFINLGLTIFALGILAWFYARLRRKATADFWIYRFTRHPQYLGWILWSYGLMLRASLSRGIPLDNANPGASLPWVLSTMAIVCVALSEEIDMSHEHHQDYERYRAKAPFLLPLPRFLSRVFSAPLRVVLRKERPENRWEVVQAYFIYLVALALISLPFVLLDWPAGKGWMDWPFM